MSFSKLLAGIAAKSAQTVAKAVVKAMRGRRDPWSAALRPPDPRRRTASWLHGSGTEARNPANQPWLDLIDAARRERRGGGWLHRDR